MNTDPLITVIIPAYKMGDYISEALESIAAQSYPSWEVIVVDDCGPADSTAEFVSNFAAKYSAHRVEYIRFAENKGVSAARNAGAKAAKAEVLAFLDPDDKWSENHLELHMSLREKCGVDVVTVSWLRIFKDGENERFLGEMKMTPWEQQIYPISLALRNPFYPSAVLMSKESLCAVGGFDEAREMQHIEDWDLWLRLVDFGVAFHFLEQATVFYRKHDGAATHDQNAVRRRLNALGRKHASILVPQIGLASWQLSCRVDELETQVQILQQTLIQKIYRYFTRLLGKKIS